MVVCGAFGALHSSRVGWRREAVGIRRGGFRQSVCMSDEAREFFMVRVYI